MAVGEAIPPETLCPACDYDLGGLAVDRCPECGGEVTEAEMEVAAFRRQHASSAGRWTLTCLGAIPLILVVYSIGTAGIMVPWGGRVVVAAFVGMAAVTAVSLLGGALASLGGRASLLRVLWAIWVRHIWRLHLPWLLAPAVAACAFVVSVVLWICGMREGYHGKWGAIVVCVGFFLWCCMALAALALWLAAWTDATRKARIESSLPLTLMFVTGIVSWMAGVMLGFAAAAVSVIAAEAMVFGID